MHFSFRNTKQQGCFYPFFVFCILILSGCGPNNDKGMDEETPESGSINISVDESFKPVIDSEIKVFESSYPAAKISVHYKSEAACFRDLANKDSARLIIVTKGLDRKEQDFYRDSFHFIPRFDVLAQDAIAIIVNNKSRDTLLTMNDVRSLLRGSSKETPEVVMDGASETSTVRYAIDSVLMGKSLGKNVVAAKSSEDVINYVSAHENAVGFIGVSWIGDQDDPKEISFLKKVKIAAIQCSNCLKETYVLPYQANIHLKRYPMIRDLYYILNEDFAGVGNNFVNFLQFERGQLIFLRSYLLPAKMSFEERDAKISN
jgi:phosphate transport system substrate-binding protein